MFRPLVSGGANFELRTATDPTALIPIVRDVINRVDADLPVYGIHTPVSYTHLDVYKRQSN